MLSGDVEARWKLSRTPHGSCDEVRVAVEGAFRSWIVYRRDGTHGTTLPTGEPGRDAAHELAIAVPENGTGDRERGRLCVFFPTNTVLPIALRLHATLDLTDDRNRLTPHPSNRVVLDELAEFWPKSWNQSRTNRAGAGFSSCWAGSKRSILSSPRVDFGTLSFGLSGSVAYCPVSREATDLPGNLRRPTSPRWLSLIDPESFPEVVDEHGSGPRTSSISLESTCSNHSGTGRAPPEADDAARPSGCWSPCWIDPDLRPPSRGLVAELLVDSLGSFVGRGASFFLQPTEKSQGLALPSWADRCDSWTSISRREC